MNLYAINEQFCWTDTECTLKKIEEDHSLPLAIKTTTATATEYGVPENSVVLLLAKQHFLRVIAQGIEKSCYVTGTQLEIPSTCKATFSVCNELTRDDDAIKYFTSVNQVASDFPRTVYLEEEMTVTLPNNDSSRKFTTTTFKRGDQLHVLNLVNIPACEEDHNSYVTSNHDSHSYNHLHVSCTRMGKSFHLPYSIKALFSSYPPLLNGCDDLHKPVSLHDLIEHANFPITVLLQTITGQYSPKNGDCLLHSGMRLKLFGLEEHLVSLAVVVNADDDVYEVREFTSDATFLLPQSLLSSLLNKSEVLERNEYLEQVRSSVSTLNLHDKGSLVEKYCQFICSHIPGTKKSVDRKTFSNLACLRNVSFDMYQFQNLNSTNQRKWKLSRDFSRRSQCTSCDSDDSMWGEFAPLIDSRSESPSTPAEKEDAEDAAILAAENGGTIVENNPDESSDSSQELTIQAGTFSLHNHSNMDQSSLPHHSRDRARTNKRNESKIPITKRLQPKSCDETIPKELYRAEIRNDVTIPKGLYHDETDTAAAVGTTAQLAPRLEIRNDVTIPKGLHHDETNTSGAAVHLTPRPSLDLPGSQSNLTAVDARVFHVHLHLDNTSGVRDAPDEEPPTSSRDDRPERVDDNSPQQPLNDGPSLSEGCAGPSGETQSKKVVTQERNSNTSNASQSSTTLHTTSSAQQFTYNISSTNFPDPSRHYISPPANWHPPEDVASMTVNELRYSLRCIGIKEEVVQYLYCEKIDGYIFTKLPSEVLKKDLQLNNLQVIKIKHFIRGWRPKFP